MEMLIVVAIIAVLIAIAIPVFTSQLEKSREATDAANIRSAYGVIQSSALTQDSATEIAKLNNADTEYSVEGEEGARKYTATVKLQQQQDAWQSVEAGKKMDIGGIALDQDSAKANGTATITYTQADGKTNITIAPKA